MLFWIFFFIWTCFGSFSTVLIERWHNKRWGIMFGRSECPTCHHILSPLELVPIFSFIFQKGKCKNCKKHIWPFYPIAEIYMWLIFMIMSWVALSFWYYVTDIMWWIFIVWGFITWIYILYDFRYMEIPDEVLVPWIYGTLILLLIWVLWENLQIFFDISTYTTFHTFLIDHISAAIILYSFLYVQILIPWGFFLLKHHKTREFLLLWLSYFTFPFTLLIDFFRKEKNSTEIDIPTWVGWWDLRVAIFIGLTLWSIHGIASFFIAYIIWSMVGVSILVWNHSKWKKSNPQIPFWPFLGIGWILSLLFYSEILNFLNI